MYHLISINCRYSHSCLALFYVRNEIEKHLPDARSKISQFTINDPYYKTLTHITGIQAKARFFSVYIWNHTYVARLLKDLGILQPEIPIILGGPQAAYIALTHPGCTVVTGPVEGLAPSFYDDLEKENLNKRYEAQVGTSFPSPYRQADYAELLANRQVYYESSRGCPFSCSYCLSSNDKRVLHKDLQTVEKEITAILASKPKIIKFVDRTFNDKPERALALWQLLARLQGTTMLHFEVAPNRFTQEMFGFLRSLPSGKFQFEIGIQSLNGHVLDAVSRKMDTVKVADTMHTLVAMDTIHIHADLILGLPDESKDEFLDSFNRLFTFAPHYIQMGLLKVLPGTKIEQQAQERNMCYCQSPPYEILCTNTMSHEDIRELYEFGELVEKFYNCRYFRSLWSYLNKKEETAADFFLVLLETARSLDFFNRSPTQAFLNAVLYKAIQNRPDTDLLLELLRFDWLRCGHRYLPEQLQPDNYDSLQREIRRSLPQNLEGLYSFRERDRFLKTCSFSIFPAKALHILGHSEIQEKRVLCFLPLETTGVYRLHQFKILPTP